MRNLTQIGSELRELLAQRILILDGAMGTMLQRANLTAADFGGPKLEGCFELLAASRPDVISGIHRKYLEAGADIIESDSFGSTSIVLGEYDQAARSYELSRAAAQLARRAADEFSSPAKPRFVAGAMGPTTKAISVTGGVSFGELRDAYHEQARGLIDGGADLLLFETCQDTRNIKAAALAVDRLAREIGHVIPVMISATIEPMGTMLAGQDVEALWSSLEHLHLLAVGLNCGTGPEFMTDHVRTLAGLATCGVSCYPNAGLPNEEGRYLETPTTLAAQLEKFVRHGWLNLVGGCCGTTEEHIRAIAQMAAGQAPRRPVDPSHRAVYSGIESIEAESSTRPLLVGERTNVIGSRLFKGLVAAEQWDEASEIARRQVKSGAHIVDVCLQSTEREERSDIAPFYEKLIRKVKVPLMIDTTDAAAIESALTYCQGKSLINSINLEDGEEKFQRVVPLARSYGAAVVVGCIDEDPKQAQAFTRERKLSVADRSYKLLTENYGLPPEDIVFDPLVFPCATGDENYIGGAVETMEGIRLIKAEIPFVRTILGISNVSFGLPAGAREIVNSVFLYHCTKAGLDLAIVNAERIERFASIPESERKLAEDLLFNTPPTAFPADHPQAALLRDAPADWREQTREQKIAINQFHIAAIADHFRSAKRRERDAGEQISLDARLARYIVEGSRDGLVADLELKRAEGAKPLDIINGPLMTGMAEVGRLFNANELIVAEVLQSAEAMKAAVGHLEQFMETSDMEKRARILLATVKGDVHDIGKNLVEIVLKNNGYEVINLGIKVPPEDLIRAFREHHPDAIGLSGLLVKSAEQMAITATDLRDAGIDVPLLVGGAALSDKFTRLKIAPRYGNAVCYAKDAMNGLDLMNQLSDTARRDAVLRAHAPATEVARRAGTPGRGRGPIRGALATRARESADSAGRVSGRENSRRAGTQRNLELHQSLYAFWPASRLQRTIREGPGRTRSASARALRKCGRGEARGGKFLKVRAVWQFFEAERDGNAIHLFAAGSDTPLHTFRFPRQRVPGGLCLSDYILPRAGTVRDHLALFVVTAGEGIRDRAEESKREGRYFYSHALQALAIESAEACAEWLHRRIREDWGFPDPPTLTMADRFTAKYRGKRYSFGYPACPNLDDQAGMWQLLLPERIGVRLTEGFMMDPEASVSALVFQHPDCTYFSAVDTAQS
jgi:5-methyltetrahydrofolate--homocysteine methyltransferase